METLEQIPVISTNPAIQAHYARCRSEGTSHSLAEMFARAKPPRAEDDTTWLTSMNALQKDLFEKAPQFMRDHYQKEAAAQGNISGAVYMPNLATYPGDPKAWVHGQGDVKRRVEELGWNATGAINVKARDDQAPPDDVGIADDIVEEAVMCELDAHPELQVTPELIQATRDKIKPHWVDD